MRIEIHAHTDESSSCGKIPAKELVRLNKEAGVDALTITDHYSTHAFNKITGSPREKAEYFLRGWRIAKEEGEKLGIHVLFGMELRVDSGPEDFLIYGIDENFVYENLTLYNGTLQDAYQVCNDYGALLIQAHPFRESCRPQDPRYLHGMEVYNGHPRHDSQNHLALQYAQENGIWLRTSGSDIHQLPDIARGGILIDGEVTTSRELAEYLRQRKPFKLLGE